MSGLFEERCQFENTVYRYLPPLGTLRRLRRGLRRLPDRYAPRPGTGKPSRFAPGERVRVLDAEAIRATLDGKGTLRGLSFTAEQWAYCGGTYEVDSVVRRLMNDGGLMRPISRSVTLAGVLCDGVHRNGGCGRACPLIFRDEWLEPVLRDAGHDTIDPFEIAATQYARVRSVGEIRATLDGSRRHDGVMFWPAMERHAGARYAVRKAVQPLAATWWRRPGADWFILEGVRCAGEPLDGIGPCHRGCALLWHRDWLEFESAPPSTSSVLRQAQDDGGFALRRAQDDGGVLRQAQDGGGSSFDKLRMTGGGGMTGEGARRLASLGLWRPARRGCARAS